MSSDDTKFFTKAALGVLLVLCLLLGIIMGSVAGFKAFGRSQAMADARNEASIALVKANNEVTVTNIQIQTQAQQLKVHQQQAEIRQADAIGIRDAEDAIAAKLTPLYVQWEYAQALEKIAESGRNNSVVYIPTGAGGVPLIANASGTSVGAGH